MTDIERLAAINARLTATLSKQGFKITYKKSGDIQRIIAPRRPMEKHTAVTWAKKKGFKSPNSVVRHITKDRAVSYRKYKNTLERAEHITEARSFLYVHGHDISTKFFNKVPMYALRGNDFYENVNALLNSMLAKGDNGERELEPEEIKYAMKTSLDRIRKANRKIKGLKGK